MFDPKDSKTIGYHLFLLPNAGELQSTTQQAINGLAEKFGGPKFDSHVTLLARIPAADEAELVEKTKQLASMMQPFEIELGTVEGQDAYFRALYWKAAPNAVLSEYHQKALEIFGVQDANTYMPHLSLFYGNVEQPAKDEMIASLKLPAEHVFKVDKIYLYRTEGQAQDWVQVGSYMVGE